MKKKPKRQKSKGKSQKSKSKRQKVSRPEVSTNPKVYINGKLVSREDAKISIFDHGLLYGDGVFEGIRVYDNLIFKLKEHIDRLFESAHAIMLKIPIGKRQVVDAIIKTLKANGLKNTYIRIIITRGIGDLGLDPRKCSETGSLIIITEPIIMYPEKVYREGISIVSAPTRRNIPEAVNSQIKSLNYLNNILAKIDAINCGVEEAIMLNHDGYVTECSGENIFIVENQQIITPSIHAGVLNGVTRATVIELANKAKIPVDEELFTRCDIYNATECFLTGTAAEIIPVVKVDGRIIGTGKPGPVTLRLIRDFQMLTKIDGVRY